MPRVGAKVKTRKTLARSICQRASRLRSIEWPFGEAEFAAGSRMGEGWLGIASVDERRSHHRMKLATSALLKLVSEACLTGGLYQDDNAQHATEEVVERHGSKDKTTSVETTLLERATPLPRPFHKSAPQRGPVALDLQHQVRHILRCRPHRFSSESLPRVAFSVNRCQSWHGF